MFFRMVYKSGQIFLPFCHNTRVWQTGRQTDGRTDADRQTDWILITIPRLHYLQRSKKRGEIWSQLRLYLYTHIYGTLVIGAPKINCMKNN